MKEMDLRHRFFLALSELKGLDYEVVASKERTTEYKQIIDELIFQELPQADKDFLIKRAKTHRMALPPTIQAMSDRVSAQQQIISLISLMEASDNWDEFKELQQKRSSKKQQAPQEPAEEPLSDFDNILLGIMSVPKSDLDKTKDDASKSNN